MYLTGVGLLFLLYRMLPNTAVPARAATIATLAVTIAWEAARWIFTAYVVTFGTYGSLCGSFGAGVAALVWIYYDAPHSPHLRTAGEEPDGARDGRMPSG
jgi:YihY family inner membrane protein